MSIPFNGSGNEVNGTPGPISFAKWVHVCRVFEPEQTMDQRTRPDGMTLKEWQEWSWTEHPNECLGWSKALSNEEIIWMHANKQ